LSSKRLIFSLNIGGETVKRRGEEKFVALDFFQGPLEKARANGFPVETRAARCPAQEPAVSRPKTTSQANPPTTTSGPGPNLSHLRREVRTALELAVVALAPSALIERLAAAAGLLEALIELPANSPPALALIPGLVERTQASLDDWQTWLRANLEKKMPRS
jgi:hypothetical protein